MCSVEFLLNYRSLESIREIQRLKGTLPVIKGKSDVSVEETGRSNQVVKDGIALAVQSTGCSKIRSQQKMRQLAKLTMWRVAASSYE